MGDILPSSGEFVIQYRALLYIDEEKKQTRWYQREATYTTAPTQGDRNTLRSTLEGKKDRDEIADFEL